MFIMLFYKSTLDLLAMKTRQINALKSPAQMTPKIIRRGNLLDLGTTLTRGIYSPEIGTISTRGIGLPENPPSPLRIARQDPARHPPPPPQKLHATEEGGRGQETDPACPCILNRYFYFHSPHMNDYIFLYGMTHMHSIQSGLMNESITILL
jgi:hypothetical protein